MPQSSNRKNRLERRPFALPSFPLITQDKEWCSSSLVAAEFVRGDTQPAFSFPPGQILQFLVATIPWRASGGHHAVATPAAQYNNPASGGSKRTRIKSSVADAGNSSCGKSDRRVSRASGASQLALKCCNFRIAKAPNLLNHGALLCDDSKRGYLPSPSRFGNDQDFRQSRLNRIAVPARPAECFQLCSWAPRAHCRWHGARIRNG